MSTVEVIDPRFNGPAASGHGGYSAGVLARHLDGPAEVRLMRPPPLGEPLAVVPDGDGLALRDGNGETVATARPALIEIPDPPAVSLAQAAAAARDADEWLAAHAFPTCFGCGPAREPGDGLRIFAGPVADVPGAFAATWTADPGLADDAGHIAEEFVWSAIDCPSAMPAAPSAENPVVLASLAARINAPVPAGREYALVAWAIHSEGRKHQTAVVLQDESGRALAAGRALWIQPRAGHEVLRGSEAR